MDPLPRPPFLPLFHIADQPAPFAVPIPPALPWPFCIPFFLSPPLLLTFAAHFPLGTPISHPTHDLPDYKKPIGLRAEGGEPVAQPPAKPAELPTPRSQPTSSRKPQSSAKRSAAAPRDLACSAGLSFGLECFGWQGQPLAPMPVCPKPAIPAA